MRRLLIGLRDKVQARGRYLLLTYVVTALVIAVMIGAAENVQHGSQPGPAPSPAPSQDALAASSVETHGTGTAAENSASASPAASPTPSGSATPTARVEPAWSPAPAMSRGRQTRAGSSAATGAPHAAPLASPPRDVVVDLTDSGAQPASVAILVGGMITWKNVGTAVHTATVASGSPIVLDSGGLAPGQSFSYRFMTPGSYDYTSATDCLFGNKGVTFDCAAAHVQVLPHSPPIPAAQPAGLPPVIVTDAGFTSAVVRVRAGGSVTWVNQGDAVHTATSLRGETASFDTGGLAPGQSKTIAFISPGQFAYSSATDCLNGNRNSSFACGRSFVVNVLP